MAYSFGCHIQALSFPLKSYISGLSSVLFHSRYCSHSPLVKRALHLCEHSPRCSLFLGIHKQLLSVSVLHVEESCNAHLSQCKASNE